MPEPGPARAANEGAGLVRRLLGMSLAYRRACVGVFVLHLVLLALGVSGLSLSGVAIDLIRSALFLGTPPPRWPLGFTPPTAWDARSLLIAIGAAVLGLAAFRALFSF